MKDVGEGIGKDDPHFSAIIKLGIDEKLIGQTENEMCDLVSKVFYFPIKDIIDQDCKKMHHEKDNLEKKRLNYEIAKGKLRKATSGNAQYDKIAKDTDMAAYEFNDQQERILKLLQVIDKKLFGEKALFKELIDKQVHFHTKSIEYLNHAKLEIEKLS